MDSEREYEEQLAQLDPELRARIEEWRTAQTMARAEPLSAEEISEARYDVAGTWKAAIPSAVLKEFLHEGGWRALPTHVRTGRPVGRPTAYPEGMPEEELERIRQAIGVTKEDFKRLVPGPGRRRLSTHEVLERVALEVNISRLLRRTSGSGITRHLADAYGSSKGTISKLAGHGRAFDELLRFMNETKSP
jgi:hypothetical protein